MTKPLHPDIKRTRELIRQMQREIAALRKLLAPLLEALR